MAVTVTAVALSFATATGVSAQGVDEPSPTIATTEPEVPVERSEEMSATETRLRTIVVALAGLGGVLVVCTAIFWKVTRPPRRAEVEETLPGEVTPLLPPVADEPLAVSATTPGATGVLEAAGPSDEQAGPPTETAPADPVEPPAPPAPAPAAAAPAAAAPATPSPVASSPDAAPVDDAAVVPEVMAPPVEAADPEALDAARSLFDRLGAVPDMER